MGEPGRKITAAADAARGVLDCVCAIEDPLARANAAGRLARELRAVSDEASAVQRAEVLRTYDEEGLSFGQLARRYGISKTLAYNAVKNRDK